jgi:GNAT superfamily N-acetyltransferase
MERFRVATESDVDAIVDMMRRYYAEDGYPFVDAEARAATEELIRDENLGRLWVARSDNGLCGYVAVTLGYSLEYRGRDAFVDELFIAEGSRGQGLGREALSVAEAYCRRRGVRALHLEVEHHREPALELYRRLGFADDGRRLMTKWLSRG